MPANEIDEAKQALLKNLQTAKEKIGEAIASDSLDPEFLDLQSLDKLTNIVVRLEASLQEDDATTSLGKILQQMAGQNDC